MNGEEEQELDSSGLELPEFRSVDAVQRMISKLEKVKANMLTNVSSALNANGLLIQEDAPSAMSTFDDLSLIDIPFVEEKEEEWLVKPKEPVIADPRESDLIISDPTLLNVRFNLLNLVKDVIKEEKEVTYKIQREDALARLKAIKSTNANLSPVKVFSGSNPGMTSGKEKPTINYPTISRSSEKHKIYPTISRGTERRFSDMYAPSPRDNGSFTVPPADAEPHTVRPHMYMSPSGKQIDTRTYTRPKKNRKSLSVCEDFESQNNSLGDDSPAKSAEDISRPGLGLNETFTFNDDCNGVSSPMNTSINMSPDDSPRKVTRNLSYIIRRDSDGQINNNPQPAGAVGQAEHLNATFNCSREEQFLSSPSDSNNSLHNISMEELHNMARLQEQSLRVSSTPKQLSRKETHTVLELPNIDERPRPPGRTSSTDTYCVVQSNPDSAESSGLSSPMDAQSYEDIQTADAVRRSMPNLALIKGVNGLRSQMLQLAPPMNSLKHKSHHISDSKLSHFVPRSTMAPRTSSIPSTAQMQCQNPKSRLAYQRPPLSYSASGAVMSNGSRIPNNNVRSGLPTPRYTSVPSREGSRVMNPGSPRAMPAVAPTAISQPTFVKPQSARTQTRIPAPGAIRNRVRPVASARDAGAAKDPDDWRAGCY